MNLGIFSKRETMDLF